MNAYISYKLYAFFSAMNKFCELFHPPANIWAIVGPIMIYYSKPLLIVTTNYFKRQSLISELF